VKNILIGGIGNVLLGDDGVGPYIARFLDAHYTFEPGIEIADLGTPALDLIDQISGRDAVILVDSVSIDAEPGTIVLYRKEEITRLTPQVRMDPHSPALVETLLAAEMFGKTPAEVLLIGIVPQSFEAGCALSDPVAEAVEDAIAKILGELERWGVAYQKKPQPDEISTWWTSEAALQALVS